MFNRLVDRYERLNHLLSLRIDQYWRRKTLRYLKPPVLDLCCGTGEVAALLHRFGRGPVIGVDFAERMLRQARRRRPYAWYLQADARALPLRDAAVPTVSCFFSLRNLSDLPAFFAEVYRVLQPGGRAVFLDMTLPPVPLRPLYSRYLRWILPRMAGLLGASPEDYRYLADSIHRLQPQRIGSLLKQAGFVEVAARSLVGGTAGLWVAKKPL